VRIVEREDEALSVASVMIRNHGLLRAMQRNRKLTTMEREASTIQINIQKLEQHPVSDTAKIQRLKSALSQCQADIKMFKASGDSSTEVIVSHSSRAAHSIADYRGQPLWDPELQTAHMECDRAGAVIRAAYNGDMAILSQIGISKEMVDEHEGSAGLQTRPARIQQDMDVIKHLLDQMNQVQTDDPEHHQKAKEMQAEWDRLNLDHIVASTRCVCVCVCVCVCAVWIVVSAECEYYMGHPTPVSHGRGNLMKYARLPPPTELQGGTIAILHDESALKAQEDSVNESTIRT
jgi:hypothetical protein